jgi:hypothetical protein
MTLQNGRLESDEIKIVYLALLDSYGFYQIRPGKSPFICLNIKLLDYGFEVLQKEVFNLLLEMHRAIPEDSAYRLYERCDYYEDLLPAVEAPSLHPEPEIAFLGVAMWRERTFTRHDRIRLIGGVAFRVIGEDLAG